MSVSKLCNKYLNGFLFYEIPYYFYGRSTRDFRGQLSNGSHFSFTLETFFSLEKNTSEKREGVVDIAREHFGPELIISLKYS